MHDRQLQINAMDWCVKFLSGRGSRIPEASWSVVPERYPLNARQKSRNAVVTSVITVLLVVRVNILRSRWFAKASVTPFRNFPIVPGERGIRNLGHC